MEVFVKTTSPFGATLGDVLTKSHDKGGLDFGTMGSSAVLAALLAIFILYTTLKRNGQMIPDAVQDS